MSGPLATIQAALRSERLAAPAAIVAALRPPPRSRGHHRRPNPDHIHVMMVFGPVIADEDHQSSCSSVLLRVRHRQRRGVHGRLSGDQASHLRSGRAAVGADGRTRGRVAVRQGDRCRSGPAGGVPAEWVVNISAMSFGLLSGSAIEALNRGAVLADCLRNTAPVGARGSRI